MVAGVRIQEGSVMAIHRRGSISGSAARFMGLAVLGAVVFTASGCLIRRSTATSITGNRVTSKSLARLVKGETTEEFVLATIGTADQTQELSDGTVLWKYYWTESRKYAGTVFLLFGGESSTRRDGKAFIRFKDGIVQDFWVD